MTTDNEAYPTKDTCVTIIGGGLAGSEAAWQLACRGIPVSLYEMRPHTTSPAHHTDLLGELVCSNSLKSCDQITAAGQLKRELDHLGSLVLDVAHQSAVPAGGALAVDRDTFAAHITERVSSHPHINVIRKEIDSIPQSGPVIIASGPLTSPALESALTDLVGAEHLAFFDAAAPIISAESIDDDIVFAASRYEKGGGADYLNCPLDQGEYVRFIENLLAAECVTKKEFEADDLFHACKPIEEIARTGHDAPRFGPLKPVGLTDPRTGERPWAVVQLRTENRNRTAFNLVGFQTNLTFSEQQRVFRMIPGLENAEFLRYGVMHRNTFLDAPRLLDRTLALRAHPRIRCAGQITGTEGYLEAAASGLIAALNTTADLRRMPPFILPAESAFGALIAYATDSDTSPYQPMHVNWGLVPPLENRIRGKRDRYAEYARRADEAAQTTCADHPLFRETVAEKETATEGKPVAKNG